MSKTTSSTSTISLNGTPKSRVTTYSDGRTSSNYNMSPWEQAAYEYSQKEFANNLQNINVFSAETLKGLNDQVEAYKSKGIKQINDIYGPMLQSLQNNVASRFGNLDNSIFLDKLSQVEGKRADSINSFAQDLTTKEQELIQNELANRYNYLNYLNGYQNQMLQNASGMTNTGQNMLNSNISYSNTQSNNLQNQLNDILLQSLMGILPK